jgi:hypothetical protein
MIVNTVPSEGLQTTQEADARCVGGGTEVAGDNRRQHPPVACIEIRKRLDLSLTGGCPLDSKR